MPDLTAALADVTAEARRLIDDLHPAEALDLLERADGPAKTAAALRLARASALAALERFHAAYEIVGLLVEGQELAELERLEARLLRTRILRKASPLCDEACESALALAQTGERLGGPALRLAGEARLEAATLFGRKRCRGLAERELERAARALPDDPRVHSFAGHVLLDFDERTLARERFQKAMALGSRGERLGRLGLAQVATLAGEFGSAHAELDAVGPFAPGDLWARWQRTRLFGAEQRWEDLVRALEDMLSASPQADSARRLGYERACALYRAGRVAEARAAFAALGEGAQSERDFFARSAGRAARLLAREDAAGRPRRRLQAFPSVAQLRRHCGPAACELYLRFFGMTASQIEIAREIKFPDGGTPVYRMRRYLEKAGFHTRRIEADLERLRRLLDAGVPVIMEEDYSDSRHVAVAIGYDDAREILEVQDPMTHEVRETFYEDLPRLRDLSNHGALVAVPAGDAARPAALEAAGAPECRYIALVDEAWAARDEERPADGDRLAEESLALRRDYELCWFYLFQRARERAGTAEGGDARVALHRILGEINAIWPDDEWPQVFLGQVLYLEGRYEEALAAFRRARDRDDPDPNNWSMMADCLLSLGRYDEAADALAQALERDPGHVRANENLAWLCHRRGQLEKAWLLNDAARELNPKNPFNHVVHATLLGARGDWHAALGAYDAALRSDPERRDALIERAKVLARLGRVDEAQAALHAAIAKRPDDLGLRVELADLLYGHDRAAEAAEVCRELLARQPDLASGHAIRGAALARLGDLEAGLAALRRALELRPVYAWVYAEMGRHLGAAGRTMEAVQACAAALGLARSSPQCEWDLGDALCRAGYPAEGTPYLRQAALRQTLDEEALLRLGKLLAQTESGAAAHDFFAELERARPRDRAVLRAHVRTLVEALWAPGAARKVIEELAVLDPEDPHVLAARGADLVDRALESEPEGEALLRRALERTPGATFARRLYAERLGDRGRFAEALVVLEPAGDGYESVSGRARALLGLSRLEEAEAAIARLEQPGGRPGAPSVPALKLRLLVARRRWDWAAALALCEELSVASHERDDDGQLDHWEEEKFECLCMLGLDDRALHFGERQATDGPSLGRLAYAALGADRTALAGELARRALRLAPDEATALHVAARLAELAGDLETAIRHWSRIGVVASDWHLWHENLARVAIGAGQLERASSEAELAVRDGHTCPHAFAVRAQVRLLRGDRAGATLDLERAWALAKPESREHEDEGVWGLRALVQGDRARADALFATYLRDGAPISENDRARLARVRAAVS